ncbi:hypothetical protein ONZ45_g11832 [Pleurotus djamor]|nr:hypothetical protein ONZ45_g11832 [Pleurotus djamor]
MLAEYIPHNQIKMFREIQATTSLIIGGSLALRFFNWRLRDTTTPPMELFVHHPDCVPVSEWLISIGCTLSDSEFPEVSPAAIYFQSLEEAENSLSYAPKYPSDVEYRGVVLRRSTQSHRLRTASERRAGVDAEHPSLAVLCFITPNGRSIILNACTKSALSGILGQDASCMMNFISSHHAYCLFPVETLRRNIVLSFRTSREEHEYLVEAYSERNWRYILTDEECQYFNVFESGVRGLGDNSVMRVDIEEDNNLPTTSDEVLEESCFYLGFSDWCVGTAFVSYQCWYKFDREFDIHTYYENADN